MVANYWTFSPQFFLLSNGNYDIFCSYPSNLSTRCVFQVPRMWSLNESIVALALVLEWKQCVMKVSYYQDTPINCLWFILVETKGEGILIVMKHVIYTLIMNHHDVGYRGKSGLFSMVWEFWSSLTLHESLWQNTTHCT